MEDAFSRSHPLVNFIYFVIVFGVTMFVQHPLLLALSFAGALGYGIFLNGARRTLKQTFLLTLPTLILVALLNPLFNHYGVTPLYYIESSGNWVTLEAMVYGVVLGSCLFIMIQWFSCFNKIMTTDKFVYLFGRIVPAISLILSMVLRFVPRFIAQTTTIRNGQKCLGMDVSNGKKTKKIRYGLNIISILVTWALENAIETADSMRSRGYGLPGRSAYSIYRVTTRDKLLLFLMAALTGIFGYGCVEGACYASYNPRIILAGFTVMGVKADVACSVGLAILSYVAFGILCFLPLGLSLYEHASMERSRNRVGKTAETTYRAIYEELDDNPNEATGWTDFEYGIVKMTADKGGVEYEPVER